MDVVGVIATKSDRSRSIRRRTPLALAAGALLVGGLAVGSLGADAAIVPTVELATAGDYSVLAGTTVTNTGPSILDLNLGVSPDAAVVGFPPGTVLGVTHAGDDEALQAQADLTLAYVDAANRPINATTTADLGGLTLVGGVYSGPSNGALSLTGPLVLDGEGDPNSVFIFQTGSTLITASSSTVTLINGAQECNVFWQVGSSATLGTDSTFRGNILALTSISVNTGVTIGGRALARNGAVTLDDDVFTTPTCDLSTPPPPTTTTAAAPTTTVDVPPTTTGNGSLAPGDTGPGAETTAAAPVTVPEAGVTTPSPPPTVVSAPASATPASAPSDLTLPQTGRASGGAATLAGILLLAGATIAVLARRSTARGR